MQYGFIVKKKNGEAKKDFSSGFHQFDSCGDGPGSGWGSDRCFRRLDMIEALVNGTLIIEVRMRSTAEAATAMPFIPENPLGKSILSMFNDEESADIIFEVNNEPTAFSLAAADRSLLADVTSNDSQKRAKTVTTFHAHQIIMEKCASNVLAELCKTEDGLAAITVLVTDVKPDIFKHILHYIYGGKVSDEDMNDNAKDIIDAADKYGIVGLKLEAEASLVNSTTTTFDNAIDNLLYADSKNCALLKEAVIDFIAENSTEAAHKLSFGNVPGHVIPDLLTAMNRKGSEGGTIPDTNDLKSMRVNALRKMLHKKGLDVDGSRETMIARLEEITM